MPKVAQARTVRAAMGAVVGERDAEPRPTSQGPWNQRLRTNFQSPRRIWGWMGAPLEIEKQAPRPKNKIGACLRPPLEML
jgi:hypothetical protein